MKKAMSIFKPHHRLHRVTLCRNKYANKGFSVVEVVLATALFGLLVTGIAGAYLYGQDSTRLRGAHIRALYLAEEGLEAVRNIKDNDFANLVDGTYGVALNANTYTLSGAPDTTDIFTRSITVATVDDNRKNVTSQVTWNQSTLRTGNITLMTRLTNFLATLGDWSNPLQESFYNIAGAQNATKVQVLDNYAYVIRSNSGSLNFYIFDVSNPSVPAEVGSLNLAGIPQNIFVLGNYAYITSSDDASELQVIDVTDKSAPVLVGTYNDAGVDDGRGIFVSGDYVFMTLASGVDFVIVDITNPALPFLAGSLNIADVANELVVSGDYSYVVSSNNSSELIVIDVTNKNAPTLLSSLNLPTNNDANTVSLLSNYLYIGQSNTLRVVNIGIPGNPNLTSSLVVSTAITDIALNFGDGGKLLFLSSSDNSAEFRVIDIANPALPIVFGTYNTTGNDNLNGVDFDENLNRAFGVGDRDAEEFRVFAPQ